MANCKKLKNAHCHTRLQTPAKHSPKRLYSFFQKVGQNSPCAIWIPGPQTCGVMYCEKSSHFFARWKELGGITLRSANRWRTGHASTWLGHALHPFWNALRLHVPGIPLYIWVFRDEHGLTVERAWFGKKKRSPQTIAHIERLQYIGFIAHRVICGEALHHGAPMGTAQHHEWTAVETNMELEKLPSFGKKSKEKTRLERHPFLGGNCYTLVFRGVSLQNGFSCFPEPSLWRPFMAPRMIFVHRPELLNKHNTWVVFCFWRGDQLCWNDRV